MEIQLSVATSAYAVDKLPKGAKVIGYEIHHKNGGKLLGKGEAFTVKQVLKRMDFHVSTGMTVDVSVIAMDGEHKIKMTNTYALKASGPVKVE